MLVRKELIKILACPKCRRDVKQIEMFIVCSSCKLAYPVLGDVPDMLIEDAWKLEKAKKNKFKHKLKV